MATLTRKIQLPSYPNFVRFEGGTDAIDVLDLSDDELQAIGDEWARGIIGHVKARREHQANIGRIGKLTE